MPSSGVQTCALRSEEHTSELQSHDNLVCRLLLEKKQLQPRPPRPPPSPPPLPARPAVHRCRGSAWLAPAAGPRSREVPAGPSGCLFFFLNGAPPRDFSPFPPPALFLP